MKLFKWSLVIISLIYYSSAQSDGDVKHTENKEKSGKNKFVATNEWQAVSKDEPLPPGLHVRMNMETGHIEAKLMEKVKTTRKPGEGGGSKGDSAVVVVTTPTPTEGDVEKQTVKEIKKEDEDNIPTVPPPQDTSKYRSYEDLKKDLNELNMAVKTDLELMNDLFEKYKLLTEKQKLTSPNNEDKVLAVLIDLEYLVHQIDNANEFSKNRGFQNIVFPALNSTSAKIRTEAARLLGSAVQNNVKAQITALEGGTVGIFLRMLALDSTPEVQSSVFYALACLVRKFPAAQKAFVDEGGVTVLSSLFSGESSDQLKLQVKVVTFINDLMVERQDAEDILTEAVNSNYTANSTVKERLIKEAEERIRQYKLVNLETNLREQHWCQNLHDLLLKEIPHGTNLTGPAFQPDHDVIEKVSAAMLSHINTCHDFFTSDRTVVTVLNDLTKYYKNLSLYEDGSDETDEYFIDLSKQLETLSSKLYMLLNVKDEL